MMNVRGMIVTVLSSFVSVEMRMASIDQNSLSQVFMYMMTIFMAMAMFVVNHIMTMMVSMFLA